VFLGAVVAVLLLFRAAWALVGTRHARLAALRFSPRQVAAHARGLLRGDAPRFLGHNPLAAWAMVAAFGLLAALSLSGWLVLGGEEQRGVWAGVVSIPTGLDLHRLHGWLSCAVIAWLGLHLAGVVKESLRTRENLAWSMVSGRKRPEPGGNEPGGTEPGGNEPGGTGVPSRWRVAALGMGLLVLAGEAPLQRLIHLDDSQAPLPWSAPALAQDPSWTSACGDCHLPFHPSLLPARSWDRMLDEQGDHFGEDLVLDADTVATLRAFALANAAEAGATETAVRALRSTPADRAPQRITETAWWQTAHADIPPAAFETEPVRQAARCDACHRDARDGTFLDGAMAVPSPTSPTTPTPPEGT